MNKSIKIIFIFLFFIGGFYLLKSNTYSCALTGTCGCNVSQDCSCGGSCKFDPVDNCTESCCLACPVPTSPPPPPTAVQNPTLAPPQSTPIPGCNLGQQGASCSSPSDCCSGLACNGGCCGGCSAGGGGGGGGGGGTNYNCVCNTCPTCCQKGNLDWNCIASNPSCSGAVAAACGTDCYVQDPGSPLTVNNLSAGGMYTISYPFTGPQTNYNKWGWDFTCTSGLSCSVSWGSWVYQPSSGTWNLHGTGSWNFGDCITKQRMTTGDDYTNLNEYSNRTGIAIASISNGSCAINIENTFFRRTIPCTGNISGSVLVKDGSAACKVQNGDVFAGAGNVIWSSSTVQDTSLSDGSYSINNVDNGKYNLYITPAVGYGVSNVCKMPLSVNVQGNTVYQNFFVNSVFTPTPTATLTPTSSPTPTATLTPTPGAWRQIVGGGNYQNAISQTLTSGKYYLTNLYSAPPANDHSAGVVYTSGTLSITNGNLSVPNTSAQQTLSNAYDYNYYVGTLTRNTVDKPAVNQINTTFTNSVQYYTGFPSYNNGTGGSFNILSAPNNVVIYLIDGDFSINRNITVGAGITAAFIVKGNVTVDPSVTALSGVYIINGNLNFAAGAPTAVLTITGLVYANNLNELRTAWGNSGNGFAPTYQYTYQPAYLLPLLPYLGHTAVTWQEVAP